MPAQYPEQMLASESPIHEDAECPTKQGVPYCDMLDTGVLFSNLGNGRFQSVGKGFRISFKFKPRVLKLAIPLTIDGLPVVVNDEARDMDIYRGKVIQGL